MYDCWWENFTLQISLFFLLDILPIHSLLFPVAPWTALKRAEDYIGIVWGTYRDCVMCKGLGIVWGTRRDCIRDKSALGLCEGQASFGCWTSMADQADANGTDSLIIRHILILPLRWDRWLIYVWFDTNTNISCLIIWRILILPWRWLIYVWLPIFHVKHAYHIYG